MFPAFPRARLTPPGAVPPVPSRCWERHRAPLIAAGAESVPGQAKPLFVLLNQGSVTSPGKLNQLAAGSDAFREVAERNRRERGGEAGVS